MSEKDWKFCPFFKIDLEKVTNCEMSFDANMLAPNGAVESYVSNWYDLFSDITFKSKIIDFSPDDANMIIEHNVANMQNRKPSSEAIEWLVGFREKIDLALNEFKNELKKENTNSNDLFFFVRLDRRSPKDAFIYAPLAHQRFRNILTQFYQEEFNESNFQSREEKFEWINQKFGMNDERKLTAAETLSNKISSTEEIFDLIFQSERVFHDLRREVEKKVEDQIHHIIFREWDNCLKSHLEFRCFIYNFEITALTQYDNVSYYSDIEANKEEILRAIRDLFDNKIQEKLKNENSPFKEGRCVIDFAIYFNDKKNDDNTSEPNQKLCSAKLVEINRFNELCGASLFCWRKDHDFQVMTGQAPFEFRIVTEHMYDHVSYENVGFPDQIKWVKESKKKIVYENGSLIDRFYMWKNKI
ncbi:hypothetical protein TRFO_15397 [Tritrichomonas foetus]|uniref:Cell division cycle protein 123 n=1 Tax=Tritrichomonas foetus TaxID=1144522 RepID=A0A1J4KXG3_9EUKA|nr:hypothetical protein TRFO_15397 [Tritrichomonas foetus]|eukprot:OHT14245.1 hypothetical protein TRFO_15397 [Tritrichomonas foetus]